MRTTIAVFLLLLLLACAPPRPTVDTATLAARRDDFYRDVAVDSATVARAFEQRVLAHGANSEDDSFDILVLSGGGAKGAFGAGFLRAWQSRPEFDVVTGVSTGALIAPFAFVGTNEALDQIVSVYAHPKRDWLTTRTVAFLLGKASLFNAKGLHRELRSRIDGSLLSAVAAQAKRSRVLMVGSTDLDLGVMRIWNLGSIASAGEERLFEDALLASSAIPGAFPPVEIDGRHFDATGPRNYLKIG